METGMIVSGAVAGAIASVSTGLILQASFKKYFTDTSLKDDVRKFIATHFDNSGEKNIQSDILRIFDDFMANKLRVKMPVLNMFIDEQLISEIRTVFHEEMELQLPALIGQHFDQHQIDLSIQKIFSLIRKKMMGKFSLIILSGAIIGGLTGFLFSL